MLFHVELPTLGVILFNASASLSANVSAAKALDKKPASVIPICIVARNLLGFSNILWSLIAVLFF